MSAELVPLADLREWDRLAWRELADRAAEPNPFFDPDFVLAAARALGEHDEVALAVLRDGAGWTACVPVRRYRRWHRLPLRCLATWRHAYCLLGTPLVAPGHESEALAGIVAALRGAGGSYFASLDWVSAAGALASSLDSAAPDSAIAFEDFERATLERRPEGDYLDGWVKSKDRRELRRRSRLLGEELGGEPELVERGGEAEAIEAFLAIEASGWKGEAGTALASNPAHAQFLRETAAAFHARGALNLVFLEVAGRQVAATCNLLAGGVDFCFKVAYDEDFARFGPGRDLLVRMIDRFHADPSLRMMDSCTDPDNDLYNRLWRDRRPLRTTAIPAPGVRGALAGPALRAAMAYRDRRRERDVD
jgi:CelD/BcsL family acetyltransferase involved in cellulose biosynthesis